MNLQNWEFERAAAAGNDSGVNVITVPAGQMLVIDFFQVTEFEDNGGEITLKRNGVPLVWMTVSHDCVDALSGGKIRVKGGSTLTIDVAASLNVAMSGALYAEE